VQVTLDGRVTGRFGIDTGADHLYIDREFAEHNKLAVKDGPPQRGVVGVQGYSETGFCSIRSLAIGDERLYNLQASTLDMRAIIPNEEASPPDGLIGYDVLRRFYVTVDYPERTMTLQQTEPAFLSDGSVQSVPFETRHHLIMVRVTVNDSLSVPMALDYCASSVAITPELAAGLGIDSTIGTGTRIPAMSLGGVISADNVYAYVQDLTALQQRLNGVEMEGLIGGSFLHRHKITIDYKRERIYLH
jgi:predicted aspartyl protease